MQKRDTPIHVSISEPDVAEVTVVVRLVHDKRLSTPPVWDRKVRHAEKHIVYGISHLGNSPFALLRRAGTHQGAWPIEILLINKNLQARGKAVIIVTGVRKESLTYLLHIPGTLGPSSLFGSVVHVADSEPEREPEGGGRPQHST